MSRFKSLKEVSPKKKILISIIIIAVVVAIVFVVIKFGFPDPDLDRPHSLAYEVGADLESKNKFDAVFSFFDEQCADDQKADSFALRNLNSFYLARLNVNKTSSRKVDRLLFALSEVQDMNRVDKKIKHLEELKKNVDSTKNEVLAYCENQIMPYKESTSAYTRISDYFTSFAKKFTNYLKSMKDFENYLEEIIKTSTTETVNSNHLTQFSISLNNKRLSLCVDACEKKFIKGESVLINAPTFVVGEESKSTMFELKDLAIETFVEDKSVITQKIDAVCGYDWLNNWLTVLGTENESDFVKTLDESLYNEFKTFIQSIFSTSMIEYPTPSAEGEESGMTTTAYCVANNSQVLEVA